MQPFAGRKVMIVDDSAIVLDVTCFLLRQLGIEATPCDAPIGAPLVAAQKQPDLILVDIQMASLPGERLVWALKRNQRTAHIPVLLFSERSETELAEAVSRCGANGFLVKTSDQGVLQDGLQAYLGTRSPTF